MAVPAYETNATQLDVLQLTKYATDPFTGMSAERYIAAIGSQLKFWNGTSWVTLESGDSGDFTTITVTPSVASSTAVDVVSAALTTGKGIDMSDLNALTTGIGVHIASSATAITGAGRLLYSNHTGATGTSAVLNEFASAATDETTVLRVTASAALAAGVVLDISASAVTTGTVLDMGGLDALTTGTALNIVSNSASTGTRTLVNIVNDNALATGTTPLVIVQDAPTSTNFKLLATIGGINLYVSDQTSPNTALSAPEGSICFNASATGQIAYNNNGTTGWQIITSA